MQLQQKKNYRKALATSSLTELEQYLIRLLMIQPSIASDDGKREFAWIQNELMLEIEARKEVLKVTNKQKNACD